MNLNGGLALRGGDRTSVPATTSEMRNVQMPGMMPSDDGRSAPRTEVAGEAPTNEPRRLRPAGALRDRLDEALRGDAIRAEKLSRAGTSVAFRIDGDDRGATTLLLDRRPPEVRDGVVAAEVTIELSGPEAETFLTGDLVLGTALYSGLVTCRGPVRKYLSVDPILRGLLREEAESAGALMSAHDDAPLEKGPDR